MSTDQRARAAQRYMLCANLGTTAQVGLNMTTLPSGTVVVLYEDHIAALADERRLVWEEAAKLICPYCNDPEWITYDPEGDHISPHTGNIFVCRSRKIRAKAHAGQEG